MNILIDNEKLNLLLEQKKKFIGNTVTLDSLLSALSFLASVALASYDDLLGVRGYILKRLFVILGLFFTVKSIYDIWSSKRNNYTHEDLLEDINKLNEITHNHSIVVIKDTFQKYANRFLVYYDERWNCRLFPNFKENVNNESFIKGHLSVELKVPEDCIELSFVTEKVHQKYSVSNKRQKIYDHKFYLGAIREFSEEMRKESFEIDGIKYFWMTVQEMERDTDIKRFNMDIVNYVKEFF